MCGIFGYTGPGDAISLVLEGIKKLEYRGYDSAGLSAIVEGKLVYQKEVGKVASLEEAVAKKPWDSRNAISHTRWATHGIPSQGNAHPQFNTNFECAVVHNGIIENYEAIKRLLEKRGVQFRSQTDTEVIAQLIGYLYKGDLLKAVQKALPLLSGAFAIAVLHQRHPSQVVCAAHENPLAIGIGQGESFIASDSRAFIKYTRRVIFLRSSEIALVTPQRTDIFDAWAGRVTREIEDLEIDIEEVSKGQFQHYMRKEIHEQPQTVLNALLSRYTYEYGTAILENLNFSDEELLNIQRIIIIACGTSYHAGLIGAMMLEEKARIPVDVAISSELRYKNPIVQPHTLVIAISQSGETADTLAAMRELKKKGASILGICNVQGSTLAREVDSCLFLRAGPEIGVASTKAFTSQLTVLSLLALRLARMRIMSQSEGKQFIQALTALPSQIKTVLEAEKEIQKIAKKYAEYENFFFLGRRFMFPTALEGALKLKEIAYVNANGYPAGEMKHGPIALIDEKCLIICFCADKVTYQKMLSNLMEVKARGGKVIAIAPEGAVDIESIADEVIWVPKTLDELASIPSTVVSQLLAYHIALARGTEIDQPRNLAKSVTVE